MVLPKATRQRLYAGEVVELTPTEQTPLHPDHIYGIQTAAGRKAVAHFRVLECRRGVARVKLDGDRPRLLAQGGGDHGDGYTANERMALSDEPEAVDEATIRRQTMDARARFEKHQREEHDRDLRRRQERGFRERLSEAMSQLDPEPRAAMLAELERVLRNATRGLAA